jgi:hypothetical protein
MADDTYGVTVTVPPPSQLRIAGQREGPASLGPLSIVALATQPGTGSSPAYFFARTG